MKAIGVILTVLGFIFISSIPILYANGVLSKYGLPFILGTSQGSMAIYVMIRFCSWFFSKIKED